MAKKIHFKLDQSKADFELKDTITATKSKKNNLGSTVTDNMVKPGPFQSSTFSHKKPRNPKPILNTANSNLPIFGRPQTKSKRSKIWELINHPVTSPVLSRYLHKASPIWAKHKVKITGGLILAASTILIFTLLASINPSLFGTSVVNTDSPSASQNNEQKPPQDSTKTQPVFEQNQYVELVKPQGIKATSVNIREGACSDRITGAQNWAALGQILEGPVEKGCFDDTWQWYRVKWSNGQIGWSISDYFKKVDAERNYESAAFPDLKIKFDLNWQLEERIDQGVTSITLNNSSTQIRIDIGQNKITGTNSLPCYAETTQIKDETETYRLFRGSKKEGSDTLSYYDYLSRESFVLRTQDDFDPLYQAYLQQYRPMVNLEEPGKLPFFDLYMVDSCALQTYYGSTSTSTSGGMRTNISSALSNQFQIPVRIEVSIKDDNNKSEKLTEADNIIKSISGINRLDN